MIGSLIVSPSLPLSAGQPDTPAQFGEFNDAVSIGADPGGIIFILDRGTDQLMKYSPEGMLLLTSGGYGWQGASFDRPSDFSLTEGLDIYIADYGNHRIVRLDRQGTFVESFDLRPPGTAAAYGYPTGIAQSRFGDIFVIDGDNRQLISIGSTRTVQNAFGGLGSGRGTLQKPRRVRIGMSDRVFVLDDSAIVMFDLFGNFLGHAPGPSGSPVTTFAVDDHALYVLSGTAVTAYDEGGSSRPVADLSTGQPEIASGDVVDFIVRGEKIYFLLKRSVVIRSVADH
ncbi:MAG TPA: NHL repeat-containing protein [Bacteroidota bacterium]|nr:NHL repeat-containing protein [Bacteroidota bacterium]